MLNYLNPTSLGKPLSRYSHAVLAPEGCRWVHVSGQVGMSRDGDIPEDFEAQARLTWANLLHALRAAGMGLDDIVKVQGYITRREDLATYRSVRDEALQGRAPASTMVIVSSLVDPALLIEVDVIAAQPARQTRAAAPKVATRAKAKARPKAQPKTRAKARPKATARTKAKARPKTAAKGRAKAKGRRR
ncbi:MAG: hypothetical protein BroJett029_25300 [Alphaproteobacteria bacterium]|nr:MAG: hypothetical protein BroJett029_25300 [Alphaproteobacteria bacterium]